MKPITTYTALLMMLFATTAWHFGQQHDALAYTVLACATFNLLAFQGATMFQRPFWADGTELPLPHTGHILTIGILCESAAFWMGEATSEMPAVIVRAVGLLIQLASIGKMGRDFRGGDDLDQEAGAAQDLTIQRKTRHEKH